MNVKVKKEESSAAQAEAQLNATDDEVVLIKVENFIQQRKASAAALASQRHASSSDVVVITRSGKPLLDTKETDVYTVNTAPGAGILHGVASVNLTDEEGRMYWSEDSVAARGFQWDTTDVKNAALFDADTDMFYFVRPPRGTEGMAFTLPEVNMQTPMTFFVVSKHATAAATTTTMNDQTMKSRSSIQTYEGYIKDTGADQLSSIASNKRRKSSYVIVSRLRAVR